MSLDEDLVFPRELSLTDKLASEIPEHLKLVLLECFRVGQLEISHCTLVVTLFKPHCCSVTTAVVHFCKTTGMLKLKI